jgi:hypothetical protein
VKSFLLALSALLLFGAGIAAGHPVPVRAAKAAELESIIRDALEPSEAQP